MTFHSSALIFDLDGTLVDTAGDIVYSTNYIRAKLGLVSLKPEQILAAVGLGTPHLIAQLTGIDKGDEQRIEEVRQEFRRHYLAHQTERSALYPGMVGVLKDLYTRYDLYVLSNKPHPAVVAELNGHSISSFFKGIWGAGSLPAMKPDPIGIDTAIELGSYLRKSVVMIGDMAVDMETAEKAKIKSCFVTWGFGTLEPEGHVPQITVDNVSELAPSLDKLLAQSL